MYFDPRPKEKKADLFDREQELERFAGALSYAPLIIIIGARRTGKTSLMNVALNESGQPFAIVDFRGLSYNPSKADIIRMFESGFKKVRKKWWISLLDALKNVKGISVAGAGIAFSWGSNRVDLAELFDKVDEWASNEGVRFLAAFDEIQIIRGEKEIPRLFAHVADTSRNITLILTGSEIGLLFDFLGLQNPDSPLYGRHYTEITMLKFSESESLEFLRMGFRQTRLKASYSVLQYAVEKLDGIAGWLTLFGAKCRDLKACTKEIADDLVLEAGKLARQEALRLSSLSLRYSIVLNYLALAEKSTWREIKGKLEAKEGRSLPNPTVSEIISNLVKMTFVEKRNQSYMINDRLLAAGLQEEPLPE